MRWLSFFALGLCALSTAVAHDANAPELNVLARASVPNAIARQGEVLLASRGDDVLVRTVLHTRFADRVKKKIQDSERANWGDNPDAEQYVRTLDEAFVEYGQRKQAGDEPVALVIDFIDDGDDARVDFSFPAFDTARGGFRLETASTWRSLDLSTTYVRKNQAYILADAIGSRAARLLEQLREAGPGEGDGADEQ